MGAFFLGLFLGMQYTLGLGVLLVSFFQNFSAPPWPAAHGEMFAFLAVLLWCWTAVRSRAAQLSRTPPVTALLCVAILIPLQYFLGQIFFGGDAIALFIYVLLCLGALLVGQLYAKDPKWPCALALALLFAALGCALIALGQTLWVWNDSGWFFPTSSYRRPGANLGQPNHLATLLVMGAASLIYLDQKLKITRPVLLLLGFLLLMGLGIAESRTGLLSGVSLAFWWFWRGKVFPTRPRWSWIAGSVVALITFMWIWPHMIVSIHEGGFTTNGVGLNTAAGSRLLMWPQLWEAVSVRPWVGWGLRGTSVALDAVVASHLVSAPFAYAHNFILELAIGVGIPLTVITLVVLGIWGWTRLKSVHTPEAWYSVGLLVPFVIHNMLEYPFAYAYFLVPAMLAVGMLEHSYSPPIGNKISKMVLSCNLIIFSGLLIGMSVEYLEIEEDYQVARFEALSVGKTAADYERPHIVILTQLKALLEVTRIVPHPNMSHDNLQLLRSTAARFPWAPVQNGYALSAALNGDLPEAQRQLKVMRAMHGEKSYAAIRAQWDTLAHEKYAQLQGLAPP
jgi:O-antigen ligase